MAKREIPEINAGSMADIAFLLLIFFLVTTTMDRDTAYVRNIPKKVKIDKPPTEIEERNICLIKANSQGQLSVRGEIMENPDKISEKVLEFYRMNEQLTTSQTQAAIANPGHPGYNFPFYSRASMQTIDEELSKAEAKLEEYENTEGVEQDIIDFQDQVIQEWVKKKNALSLLGKKELPELALQAHVRIEVQQKTEYELYAKIFSELEEAMYELRNDISMDAFGESYGTIKKRFDTDQSGADKAKLDLLKVLYPDRWIEVKPKR